MLDNHSINHNHSSMDLSGLTPVKQGAEARLYTTTFLGRPVMVKQRFSKKYRHPDLDVKLTNDRHKAEARALLKCKQIGVAAPTLYLADMEEHILVMDQVPGETAREAIDKGLEEGDTEGLVRIARAIGSTVASMHQSGLIHGDITTSNLIVQGEQLTVIDFGLSSQEGSSEDKGVDLYVLERAFLSTHPNTEHVFAEVMAAYTAGCGASAGEVVRKFEEIRLRGRKRTMLG